MSETTKNALKASVAHDALIATVANDITITNFSDRLVPLDDTLAARGGVKGLKIYDEIERDTHAWAVLQKRKYELIGREWLVDPASDDDGDIEVAEFIRDTLGRLPFDRICLDLMDATLKGFSVCEIVWQERDGKIIPAEIVSLDQRRFIFDADWRLRLLTREDMIGGEPVPDRKFIVHRFNVKGNNPYGLGLGSILFWPVLFKRQGYSFWLKFLEKYASPTPYAEAPTLLPKQQRDLLSALERISQGSAITVPIGTKLNFLEATRAAPASYETFARYWDEQISETVLGETLSTNIGSVGSQAAAQVHTEGKSQIIDADGDLLSDTLDNTLIKWLVEFNFPGRANPRVYRKRPTNDKAIAEAAQATAKADAEKLKTTDMIVEAASHFGTDEDIRAFLGSFDTTAHFEEEVMEGLVRLAARVRDGRAANTNTPPPAIAPPVPLVAPVSEA